MRTVEGNRNDRPDRLQDKTLRVVHSLFEAEAVFRLVQVRYDLGTVSHCALYRSYVNDVFRISTAAGKQYYFKVYRSDWRTPADVAWELRLQHHLLAGGVSVARPIDDRTGAALSILDAPEGPRAAVLFAQAAGEKPRRPFTPGLYWRFGAAAARMHAALDMLSNRSGRAPDDVEALVLSPGRLLRKLPEQPPGDLARIDRIVERLDGEIRRCGPALDWGICHGDLTLDNVTVDEGNGTLTFFDFDLASVCWRARDPCGVFAFSRFDPAAGEFWDAFLDGYRSVRTFGADDEQAVSLMYAVSQLWDLGHEVRRWSVWSGQWRISSEVVGTRLRDIERWIEAELG